MKKTTLTGIISTLLISGWAATAVAAVPNTFSTGTPASAVEVNENFTDLDQRLQALGSSQQYTWADYSPPSTITSKTFSRIRTSLNNSTGLRVVDSCDRMIFDFSGPTQDIVTLNRSSDDSVCWRELDFFQTVDGKRQYTGYEFSMDNGSAITRRETVTYDSPKVTPSVVTLGIPWDQSTVENYVTYESDGVTQRDNYTDVLVKNLQVLGVEDVTVPAGAFTGCLKILENYYQQGTIRPRIHWRCPNMGTVKQLRTEPHTSRSEIRELLSFQ